jgi:hypothetical protein
VVTSIAFQLDRPRHLTQGDEQIRYALDTKEFIGELTKQGLELSVRERAEWVDILNQHKAKIAQSLAKAKKAQQMIDDMLSAALGLTPAECRQLNVERSSPTD